MGIMTERIRTWKKSGKMILRIAELMNIYEIMGHNSRNLRINKGGKEGEVEEEGNLLVYLTL